MLLISLKLKNFRVYYDEQIIEFSTDKNKNVTLVHAENGIGKTTMLNAIKWCLYSKTPDFSNKDDLVHFLFEKEGGFKCTVELSFEHNDVRYTATREYNQETGKSYLTLLEEKEFGVSKIVGEGQAVINSILPEELSDYFLFSGEHFTREFNSSKSNSYKQAVRDILGFTLSDMAVNDLDILSKRNKRQISALLRQYQETEGLSQQLGFSYKKKDDLEKKISRIKEQIESFEKIKRDCDRKIQSSHHFEAEQLSKEKTDKVNLIRTEGKKQNKLLVEKQNLIQSYGYAIFGGAALSGERIDFIKKDEYEGKIPAPYDEGFVNKLIREEKCICTRPLVKGTEEFDAVQELRQTANTALIHQRVQKALSIGDHFKGRAKEFLDRLGETETLLFEVESTLSSLLHSKKQIQSKLDNINHEGISELVAQQKQAEKIANSQHRELGQKESDLDKANEEIILLEKKVGGIQIENPELALRKEYQEVYAQLMTEIKKKQIEQEVSARGLINERVQKNIRDCLRTNYDVIIDENYNIKLRYEGEEKELEGSDGGNGQTLLVNLSYITALIKHSESRVLDSSGSDDPQRENIFFQAGTIAPFVVDAPFSEMDGEFKKSALEFLPKQSYQLILFLSTGQWSDEYEKIIGDRIGKRYYLVSHTKAGSKETEPLKINNKLCKTTVFDNDSSYPYSEIKELN